MSNIVIFDLDGTLCNVDHRKHFIDGTFEGYHRFNCACVDDDLGPAISIAQTLQTELDLWVITSRPIEMKAITKFWLGNHEIFPKAIYMRPVGDIRSGVDLKKAYVQNRWFPKSDIKCVFDNDPEDVLMYRAEGLTCFKV